MIKDQKIVVTIAGNDSDGSAGMPADLHSFYARGVYGMGLMTAAVAGNTKGIFAQQIMPVDFIQKQFDVLNDDFKINATKTGMLANKEIIDCVMPPASPAVTCVFLIASRSDVLPWST